MVRVEHIIGQERAIEVLQAALQSGRLHHAFIFHGPQGVGKFTAAVAFAKIVLCHNPGRDLGGRVTACGECASCKLLPEPTHGQAKDGDDANANADAAGGAAARMHPDFHVVTKELARYSDDKATRDRKLISIPIEVLRNNLLGPVYKSAQLKHNKVFVIDEAELINTPGQNALLKTLEEPPAGTHLILVTSSEDKLLTTIRSRCQRVAFLPLPDDAVKKWADRAETSGGGGAKDWPAGEKRWLIEFAGGSLGRAQLAIRYGLAAWSRSILPAIDEMARGTFPPTLGKEISDCIDAFAKRWVDEHENASKEAANKLAAALMWAMVSQHARRKIAELAAAQKPGDADANEAALRPWLGVIESLALAEIEIGTNVNLGLASDHLVSRLYRAMSGEEIYQETL